MHKVIIQGVAGIVNATDTFDAEIEITKDGLWLRAVGKNQPWHFSPWDEAWFGSRKMESCQDPVSLEGGKGNNVLQDIHDILKDPPRKEACASTTATPPDWRVAAQRVAEIVTKTLGVEPIKFRKS